MTSEFVSARHRAAIDAAKAAGAHLRRLYADRGALVIEQKGRNDFVSRADREAEDMVLAALRGRFPEDGFVGEETGVSGPAGARALWLIDPLDGTTSFLQGAHNWCVSIGLVADGRLAAGVIYDPMRDELFEGIVGAGARVNGQTIAVSPVADPGSATIGLGYVQRVPVARFCADTEALLSLGMGFRQIGAGALMLAYVAAGRVDGYFERHMWPWDAAAGLALIEAAGGRTLPYPTGPEIVAGAPVLAAGPALYDRLAGTLVLSPD